MQGLVIIGFIHGQFIWASAVTLYEQTPGITVTLYDKPINPITSSDSYHRPEGEAVLNEIETQQDPH